MNAIKFIKLYGLHSARVTVEDAQENTHYCTETGYHSIKLDVAYEPCPDCVYLSELKRLVDSLDLVKSYGGIINAKHDVKYLDLDWDYDTPRVTRLKQAIADYGVIYSNDCEILDYPEDYTSPNCKKYDERVK